MAPERSLTVRSSGRPYERQVIQVRIPGTRDREVVDNGRSVEITTGSGGRDRDVKLKRLAAAASTAPSSSLLNPDVPNPTQFSVDREKTCPLLLRVFCNVGRHFSTTDFLHGNTPSGELQIYTWLDATLKELTSLIRDVHPEARRRGVEFSFSVVFPDSRSSGFRSKMIGCTRNGQRGEDDIRQLIDVRFQIGDFLSVAITPPDRY